MKKIFNFISTGVALIILNGCTACETHSDLNDFAQFIIDRDYCDHMRGEVPDPDPLHPEDFNEAISVINKACKGADARLALFKKRFSNNSIVMQKLNGYESSIEPRPDTAH